LTLVGAVLYLGLALYLQRNFNLNLEGFLLLIAYWLGAWNAIVLIEHVTRRGNYPVGDYQDGSKLPVGVAAVTAMILGLGIATLGINQFSVIGFEGPLARALDVNHTPGTGADLGFPLAILATGILYLIFRQIERARTNR
jgi:purine-cytosine permease-like protein